MEPHDILGVPPDAAPDAVRQAYRDLVRVWHPDRFPEDADLQRRATEQLKQINAAYAELSGTGRSRRARTRPRQRSTHHTGFHYAADAPQPPPPPHTPERPGDRAARRAASFSRWLSVGYWALFVSVSLVNCPSSRDRACEGRHASPPPLTPVVAAAQRERAESPSIVEADDSFGHEQAVVEPEESVQDLDALISGLQSQGARRAGGEEGVPASVAIGRSPDEKGRLQNGYALNAVNAVRGLGELTVVNRTASEAEVELVEVGSVRRLRHHFYVHGHAQHTVGAIAPGDYELVFRMGAAGATQARRFANPIGTLRFDKVLNWAEGVTPDGIRYNHRVVTLHPVVGGNTRLASLSNETFDAIR